MENQVTWGTCRWSYLLQITKPYRKSSIWIALIVDRQSSANERTSVVTIKPKQFWAIVIYPPKPAINNNLQKACIMWSADQHLLKFNKAEKFWSKGELEIGRLIKTRKMFNAFALFTVIQCLFSLNNVNFLVQTTFYKIFAP